MKHNPHPTPPRPTPHTHTPPTPTPTPHHPHPPTPIHTHTQPPPLTPTPLPKRRLQKSRSSGWPSYFTHGFREGPLDQKMDIYLEKYFSDMQWDLKWQNGIFTPNTLFSMQRLIAVSTVIRNFNTLRPRQDGRHFPDDIFKYIFLNENVWISIKSSLKFVPKGPNKNISALVQIMARRRPGDK